MDPLEELLVTTADLTLGSRGDLEVSDRSGLKDGCWEDLGVGSSMAVFCQSIPTVTLRSLPPVVPTDPESVFLSWSQPRRGPGTHSSSSVPTGSGLLVCLMSRSLGHDAFLSQLSEESSPAGLETALPQQGNLLDHPVTGTRTLAWHLLEAVLAPAVSVGSVP